MEFSKRASILACIIAFFIFVSVNTASALSITYEATDLGDITAGEDLWQYDYRVNGYAFNESDEFTILFDYHLFDSLTPISTLTDWDIYALQPEPGIEDDGIYGSIAMTDNTSLGTFSVSFIWLGGNDGPGTQAFELYDENFELISQGFTTPINGEPVPEPGTAILFFLGLTGLIIFGTDWEAIAAPDLKYDDHTRVSRKRISRFVYEFSFTVTVTNHGTDADAVKGTFSIDSPYTTIIDAEVDFGVISTGETVTSTDTYTIRHDRRYPFDADAVIWSFSHDPPAPPQVTFAQNP